jgi:hypothetical protein
MPATAEQFQQIRDEAWKCDYVDALECHNCEKLIERVLALWDRDHLLFASTVPSPHNRDQTRENAAVLRLAEQAMTSILERAAKSLAKGYMVEGLERLIACICEVRVLIVLPMARRMAVRDPDRRDANEIAQLLVKQVRFQDGRAIVTEKVAEGFPNPFEAEGAA